MDVERRTIYTWPNHFSFWGPLTSKYWDESYGVCKIIGSNWELAHVTSQQVNQQVMMYANNTVLPIAAVRNETGYFVWANGENMTFFNWYVTGATKRPTTSATKKCAAADAAMGPPLGKQWTAFECRTPFFKLSPCQLLTGT